MKKRNYNIDIIKGLAIIAVILIHSLPDEMLLAILSPFYIWQAVPVFILLAGYNTAQSFQRRGYVSLNQFYNISFLYKKFERLVYPFLFIWAIQVIIHFLMMDGLNLKTLVISLFTGGWGPGSYFIPVIIQATLILPLIYMVIKRNLTAGVIVLFFISILVDVFCMMIDVSGSVYRIIIVRYIFALVLGVCLSLNTKNINYKWLIPLAMLSAVYIAGVYYQEWEFFIERYWQSQHAPSYFWTLLLVIIGLRAYQFKAANPLSRLLVKMGQASYHIFLVQMFYFWVIADGISDFPLMIYLAITLTICIVFGILFFNAENRLRNRLKLQRQ
ncbi:acyltransferase family protein [Salinicoccus kekensis]|uniref:Probable poly-beta-1,6-N-acetyl-D-glucosamine export protein n=1 Tax=Salinicoccus kekensis TaxID=714307 RepID=A0A285U8Z9_9STAP|nr:acyltransferase [Salinicoccus kekensis]SOC38213.1 fucose 4-O-acetylase-like acetyltransferase [Salinicoccus kekensis]